MTIPLVTVIIPCFNHGKYLRECCMSITQQQYPLEIIIVDDGSTDDESLAIAQSLVSSQIRVISTENQGPAAARNTGIRSARGKYILPVDADDKIGQGYIAEAVAILEANESVGIVYCNATYFGSRTESWILPPFSLKRMLFENIIFCSGVFRKDDWQRCGGYAEHLTQGLEDYDFWLSILEY